MAHSVEVRLRTALALLLAVGAPFAQAPKVAPAERVAIMKAAGAIQRGGQWVVCADDQNNSGAAIEFLRDLNGDGRSEALVTEGGTFCHGMTGAGYQLLSKRADGKWAVMDGGSGIPEFLATKGEDGWPDISVGGPGFCFPVLRWNGSAYALHRHQYDGKPCRPN